MPPAPLPIRDGLNPTRARLPDDAPVTTAFDFIYHLVSTQRHRHPDDDAAAVRARFARGDVVTVGAVPLTPTTLVRPGQDVWFYRRPAPEPPVPGRLSVLWHDARLVVVDKPHFMATMPRAQHIVQTATVQLRRLLGNDDLVPAHRLDRLTAGVLVFVAAPEFRGAYQSLFARREVRKTYEAIARHDPQLAASTPLTWENHILKVTGEYQARIVDAAANARTVLRQVQPLDAVEQRELSARYGTHQPLARYLLEPHTGKTHQLRVHMNAAGVPILGDSAYPVALDAVAEDFDRPLQLISRSITFVDPVDGERRTFRSQL
ncbi:pseudouridine synthase [Corynebacterium uterequi]|uniref:RNA pseudouridylate synthase n=1 Tax=Corynebacterium uterequi TaxID=1072256 RepID=A0A0G3HJM9_9CORY|nr:pseudouridine synthase [Corynebacterium uterequi]AKK12118.1 23S RNA-specific pseudouridylate synthase [Corynebacterium uterequi]